MTAITLALACVWVAGCGVIGNEATGGVTRAKLDRAASTITMPLDEYDISDDGFATISRARELAFSGCMAQHGVADAGSPEATVKEDRTYGLWIVERAKLYGFGLAPADQTSTSSVGPSGVYRELDPAWVEARTTCMRSLSSELDAFTPPDELTTHPPSFEVRLEASNLAAKDPQWKKHRDEWWQCLRDAGLVPPANEEGWSSQQALDRPRGEAPAEKEEEIRIAVKEATCNESTALTQNLGDIEAGYQVGLIKARQAALNEQKSKNLEYVTKAETYLANHQ
ncbi:hypothetical protein [Pseudarthrobacter sp. Y6]|uniref:hypothetical protein n=1 Tax=Pseudarthrobacter sp. Y6 TaxID=3418422 RepID=UPI003CEFA207